MSGGNLFNVTTADGYTDAATLLGPPAARVRVAVYNAAVAYQVQIDSGRWEPEDFLGPWVGTFSQPWVTGVRFRSLAVGKPAQVSAKLLPEGVDEGAPPPFALSSSGVVTPVTPGMTGIVNSDGTINAGTGFAAVRNALGNYSVTFTTAFAATPLILLTLIDAVGVAVGAIVYTPNNVGFGVFTFNTATGAGRDERFQFLAQAVV